MNELVAGRGKKAVSDERSLGMLHVVGVEMELVVLPMCHPVSCSARSVRGIGRL